MTQPKHAVAVLGAVLFALPMGDALARSPLGQDAPSKCGTLDALRAVEATLPRTERALSGAPAVCYSNPRPTYDNEDVYDDDEYKFRIHYTTDDSDDRFVTEQQVEQTAQVMREVIDAEGSSPLSYSMPGDDSVDAETFCDEGFGGDGGNGYYDVYFVNDRTLYGYCYPTSLVPGNSKAAVSFLALSTWILDVPGALEVTVAHEFFHAIQFGFDVYENSFWMENTAVWMEEQVYDSVNDYLNYVPEAFQNPEEPLDSTDSIMYAYGIWPMYMSQDHGPDIIRDIWDVCAESKGKNAFAAQKEILDGVYTGGWSQAVLDFRGAMYDKDEFEEGASFNTPVSAREVVTSYPVSRTYSVDHTGGDYIVFSSPSGGSGNDTLQLCFTGAAAETTAKVYVRDYDDNRTEVSFTGSNNAGSVTIEGLGSSVRQVGLVVTYAVTQSADDSYTFSASLGDTVCEPGEPGTPSEGGDPTPTGGDSGLDDGDPVTICGGCIVVEETTSTPAAAVLNLLWLGGAVLWMRRRVR